MGSFCTLVIRLYSYHRNFDVQVTGKTFEVIDPSTEEVISRVADGSGADVDKAVAAARKVRIILL
jgi:acyl-CoA reductase-like NAD-dependent aldehyde dehydrogenase